MTAALIAAAAAAGAAAGWAGRAVITRMAVPASPVPGPGDPPPGQDMPPGQDLPPPGEAPPGPARRYTPPPLTVEVTTAVLFAVLAWRVRSGPVLAAAAWLAACGVALACIDIAVRRLPDVLTAAAYAGVIVFLILAAASRGTWGDLARAAVGGVALSGALLILAIARPAYFGLGDCKAAAATGTLLAWFSWTALAGGTLAALILAGLYGAALLITRRATLRAQIPFGPFLLAGTLAALLLAA